MYRGSWFIRQLASVVWSLKRIDFRNYGSEHLNSWSASYRSLFPSKRSNGQSRKRIRLWSLMHIQFESERWWWLVKLFKLYILYLTILIGEIFGEMNMVIDYSNRIPFWGLQRQSGLNLTWVHCSDSKNTYIRLSFAHSNNIIRKGKAQITTLSRLCWATAVLVTNSEGRNTEGSCSPHQKPRAPLSSKEIIKQDRWESDKITIC
jgi:hypothetical protein